MRSSQKRERAEKPLVTQKRKSTTASREPEVWIEFNVGPRGKFSSVARKWRSIPKAFPAIAPAPKGHHLWFSIRLNLRSTERKPSAWLTSQCPKVVICAGSYASFIIADILFKFPCKFYSNSPLKMREGGHHNIHIRFSQVQNSFLSFWNWDSVSLDKGKTQGQVHVEKNLWGD